MKQEQTKKARIILHIDMNAYFCSVHEAVEPDKYRGKSTAVAGEEDDRRGVIVTCSYTARKKGIKTGMIVSQAKKLDPELIIINHDFALYNHFSREFIIIAYQYSPLLEPASIDECYLDITGSSQFGHPVEIAKAIQTSIMEQLSLPCSIGIGPNKFLAKMASDMKKPNGITVLRIRDFPKLFWDKPPRELYGVGKRLSERLDSIGIKTIGQLARANEQLMLKEFGVLGPKLLAKANGIDNSPVISEAEKSKSIGNTITLPKDIMSHEEARQVFIKIVDKVTRRLRKQNMVTKTIQITIRYSDRKTITRSLTFDQPTDNSTDIFQATIKLFTDYWSRNPVRLLGVTLQNLIKKDEAALQLDLFNYQQQFKNECLNKTVDLLRDKYGENSLIVASMIKPPV